MFTLKFASRILIVATVALCLGIASSAHAWNVDSFFDVFVRAMESGQLKYEPTPGDTTKYDTISTEMVSMSLTSIGPVTVSPTSNPHYTTYSGFECIYRLDLGSGNFEVDSFFDVFTELSVQSEATEGNFAMEILSMDWSSYPDQQTDPVEQGEVRMGIQPDPFRMSTGHVTVLKLPDGTYQVDSFFDVFTDLSMDGGTTWNPSLGSTHLEASTNVVPEPSTLVLMGMGLLGVLLYAWRRHTR